MGKKKKEVEEVDEYEVMSQMSADELAARMACVVRGEWPDGRAISEKEAANQIKAAGKIIATAKVQMEQMKMGLIKAGEPSGKALILFLR